jgi:hypothetical protein
LKRVTISRPVTIRLDRPGMCELPGVVDKSGAVAGDMRRGTAVRPRLDRQD